MNYNNQTPTIFRNSSKSELVHISRIGDFAQIFQSHN